MITIPVVTHVVIIMIIIYTLCNTQLSPSVPTQSEPKPQTQKSHYISIKIYPANPCAYNICQSFSPIVPITRVKVLSFTGGGFRGYGQSQGFNFGGPAWSIPAHPKTLRKQNLGSLSELFSCPTCVPGIRIEPNWEIETARNFS